MRFFQNVLLSPSIALFAAGPASAQNVSDDAAWYGLSPPVYPSPIGKGAGVWAAAYAKSHVLVSQMTLEEKVNMTRGYSVSYNTCSGNSGSVPRLGFPGMCLQDAGNGVRDTDFVNSYPSGIHIGATWDKNLAYELASSMGAEFRAKGANVALGPVAGPLGRVALGGRNWEGFTVDPYLSGIMTGRTVKGTQDGGAMVSLKHLLGNEQETNRRPYGNISAASMNIDDKTLHETYLWPFMDGIRAGAACVMCSYNRLNNSYGCQNSKLLNGLLKTELEFEGFVLSDWNAQHSGVGSVLAGLDMVMPYGGFWGENLTESVKNGSVSEERVTDMATRILAAWYSTGQDSHTYELPGYGIQNLSLPHEIVDARNPASRPILMEGAIAGHVLLKNANHTLPFKRPKMLSLFGYDAVVPVSKNTDVLFTLGYEAYPAMAAATLGTEQHFLQYALGGTIISGARSGANAPPYISAPFNAIEHRAMEEGTWLNWDFNTTDPGVNAASTACLVFINAIATEGWDREGLHDDYSDELIENVASKCANTIVVMHNAGIRLVDRWIEHPNITAAIMAHLPGQDSGAALVKILYGDVSPSGKLPYTLARNESDYNVYRPCEDDVHVAFPQCNFTEANYLDYKDFEARGIAPRYEFGFGLSYTTFEFADLVIRGHDASLFPAASNAPDDVRAIENSTLWDTVASVQASLRNTGAVDGAEVMQLYLGIPNGPAKQLRGFEKIVLAPGQATNANFDLQRRDLSVWSVVEQQWVVQSGVYSVYLGASSRDIRLTGSFVI
ncbi:cel3e secreted beta-glucosidase [Phlyctema vagabunda]|uniref:beta-glucosidase n=1 Tax=Phlyctema vagabunda TaxID=108571 RepID=A0ABR4PLI5_9HELO